MSLKTNLRGQIRQTALPKWKCLIPIFEAVMNAFQAIQDSAVKDNHSIVIECERDQTLANEDDQSEFSSFLIRDTGVGFGDENFDSFNTIFSEHKAERGGKGLGRIMWLVAFDQVKIESVFQDKDEYWLRNFIFNVDYNPDDAAPKKVPATRTGTSIHLLGFKNPYKQQCTKSADTLVRRIIEHFIIVFLRADCPRVEIHADGLIYSLNDIFIAEYKTQFSENSFQINEKPFKMNSFKVTGTGVKKHRLIYAANSRGVLTENLEDYIPNLSGRLEDENGEAFIYLSVVQSDYLDRQVNNDRVGFYTSWSEDNIDEDGQSQFELISRDVISKSSIRNECISAISNELAPFIASINESKSQKIDNYVKTEAPQYKPLLRYRAQFIDKISPNASKVEMEMALHKELYQREVEIKKESAKMITGAEKIDDYETYRSKLSNFIERYSELGTAALAHHVMHRKIIIDLLEKAISVNEKTGLYPLEQAVHNIIFPMHSTDQETLYSQQNLWIIDERLTFHTYIASDKRIQTLESVDSSSALRPDIVIFDQKIIFSEPVEDNAPINSIVVIEFKKPMRSDYTSEKNPVLQVFEQIREIREGKTKNDQGRAIKIANKEVPSFAYIVCDINQKMEQILQSFDAMPTPDGRSYYGYHRQFGIYYEVIDYSKIVSDAKKRNRIFFERLKLGN